MTNCEIRQKVQGFELPNKVLKILKTLKDNGYQALIVGGAVRNFLCNKTIKDYDIATDATPQEIAQVFIGKTKFVRASFGVTLVNIDEEDFEVATFRKDVGYSDGRHPDQIELVKEFSEDVLKRDFTCNALGYDFSTEEIIDYVGGISDIENNILKTVGDPYKRLVEEDCLRMLRAIRFMVTLRFIPDNSLDKTLTEYAVHITRLPWERIRDEINKMLFYADSIKLLKGYGFLKYIIPEIDCLDFVSNDGIHRNTILDNIIDSLENFNNIWNEEKYNYIEIPSTETDIIRWGLLLQETGKIKALTLQEGKSAYPNQWSFSKEIAGSVLIRLRFPTEFIERVKILISNLSLEDIPNYQENTKEERSKARILFSNLGSYINLFYWSYIEKAMFSTCSNSIKNTQTDKICLLAIFIYNSLKIQPAVTLSQLAINGRDLIDKGIKGKDVGKYLNQALYWVMKEEIPNEKEIILNQIFEKNIIKK